MSQLTHILNVELSLKNYQWLLTRLEPMLLKFQREINDFIGNFNTLVTSTVPNLLGIGEGSTPQADDLFLGMITTIICKEPSSSEFLGGLSTIKYENFTTQKSASLIRRFLRENYPKELKTFIGLLKVKSLSSSNIRKFQLEIQKIKKIGASSGYFFLVGVLWQLNFYENHRQNLIVNKRMT
ncbi:MAG: oxamate carbamoyltransferase subunit AllH family protein [Candidatus Hodarchaeales archaeon]|jgi:hypothetical protein